MRSCEYSECSALFPPGKHNQKYCGKKCNILEHNARRAKLRRAQNGPLSSGKECEHNRCFNKFQQVSSEHKYCSAECRESSRSRRGLGLDPTRFGDIKRGAGEVSLLDKAAPLYADDPTDVHEYGTACRAAKTDTEVLQVAVLLEAVQHVTGGARGVRDYEKDKLRAEAISWLRGEDDCPELGPYNSALCFEAAGLHQGTAIQRLGI